MTDGEIEHRLTVLSEQCDHNQSRLDDVERRQDSLDKLVTSVEVLATRQETVESDVKEIKSDVKAITGRSGKRWDSLVDKLIYAAAGAVLAWIAAGAPGAN